MLTDENHDMLWIAPGFAHGYLALNEAVDFLYKCTDFHAPVRARVIRWNDPTLAIEWPLPAGVTPILSTGDQAAPAFEAAEGFP